MNKQQRLELNRRNVAEFRASGGKIASFGDAPLLLLKTVGARSRKERVNPMMYMADGAEPGRVYVFASAAGAERNPAWYDNLVAHPEDLTVEIGDEKLTASAAVLPEPERARVFAKQAGQYSGFADYQARTDRRIPVVALAVPRPPVTVPQALMFPPHNQLESSARAGAPLSPLAAFHEAVVGRRPSPSTHRSCYVT